MAKFLTSTFGMRGDLRITVRNASDGSVKWRYQIRNTINAAGLKSAVSLIAQKTTTTAADYAVSWIRFGTGNTPPSRGDTNLQTPIIVSLLPYSIALDDSTKTLTVTNPYEVKIVATIPTTDLNGQNLTEAGLFTRGTTTPAPPGQFPALSGFYPELFARQIHPVIAKTVAFVVDYDWRIAFTA